MIVGLAVHGCGFGGSAGRFEPEPIVRPPADQPFHVRRDRVHILDLLLGGIGVVHPQVAHSAEFARDPEVEADGLGVADVQVAIRLGRKTGDDPLVPAGLEVRGHHVANEIGRHQAGGRGGIGGVGSGCWSARVLRWRHRVV